MTSTIGRLSALIRGGADRALTRAEEIVGVRQRPPAPALELPPGGMPHPLGPGVPFFGTDDSDGWGSSPLDLQTGNGFDLYKAIDEARGENVPGRPPKALLTDPLMLVEIMGYKERPSVLSYAVHAMMVYRMPVIQAIIQTRINQVASFCRPQPDRHKIGFKIRRRDWHTNKRASTKAERKRMAEITRWMLNTTIAEEPGVSRDRMDKFAKRFMRDSLVYDQGAFEVVPSRKGTPYSWHAVDGSSVRLADTAEKFLDHKSDSSVRTVQILDGQVIAEFKADELAFMIRNPQSSLRSHGYGFAEVEMLIHVITALLFGHQYNLKFFQQGTAPKGILNFKGTVPGRMMAAFRKHFYAMLSGVENSFRTPILNADGGVEWIDLHNSNKDMEFGSWLNFNIKLAAAIFLMDPTEVNFKMDTDHDRTLFETANQQKVTESKDKGLKPLLTAFEDEMNRMVVHRLEPDMELHFGGLDALTRKEESDLNNQRVKTSVTVDELRAEEDKEPMPDGGGEVILDPTWLQYQQQKMMAKQQAAGAGEAGEGAQPNGAIENGAEGKQPSLEDLLREAQEPEKPTKNGAIEKSVSMSYSI